MKTYDVIVVGSGPAGGEAARRLKAAGKRVALVEKDGFGGVCPLRGCNPKKVLMAVPEAVHAARALAGLGIDGEPQVNWPDLSAFRDSFVEPISEQVENHYFEIGVDVYYGPARMAGPNEVAVNGDQLKAGHIVLGPGLRPRPLVVSGCEHLSTSDDFLALSRLPQRIVFIGGGFVAMELAGIAALCGAEVTVLSRSRPLKRFDPALMGTLAEAMGAHGIDLRIGATVQSVVREGDIRLTLDSGENQPGGEPAGEVLACDMAVNCAGRIPDLDGLDLESGNVAYSLHGIEVNEYLQSTTNPAVYAAGDAADTPFALTPTATIEAGALVANILEGNSAMPDYDGVPSVCFTIPPLASAGLSVEAAQQLGVEHRLLEGDLAQWFPWKRLGQRHGGYRVLVSEQKDRILGAHLLGHHAEELINTLGAFIRLRTPLSELRRTVWAYPTASYYLKYMLA